MLDVVQILESETFNKINKQGKLLSDIWNKELDEFLDAYDKWCITWQNENFTNKTSKNTRKKSETKKKSKTREKSENKSENEKENKKTKKVVKTKT